MNTRIQERWQEQAKSNMVHPLFDNLGLPAIPVGSLTPFHISAQVVESSFDEAFKPVLPAPAQLGFFEIWVDGSLMSVKKPKVYVKGSQVPALRGVVNGFSSGARRRLMRKVATLRKDVLPLFCTLTYPAEFPVGAERWKRDLDNFSRRFRRYFPHGGFIWRLEPQRRGAPHYHLLVYGVEFTGDNARWFHNTWYEVVKSADPKHLTWGVDLQELRSQRGVRSYVGKYIAKKQTQPMIEGIDWNLVGRWWGVRFADNLPFSEVFRATGLSQKEADTLVRYMRRFLQSKGVKISADLPALTMFTEAALQWARNVDALTGGRYNATGSFASMDERRLM